MAHLNAVSEHPAPASEVIPQEASASHFMTAQISSIEGLLLQGMFSPANVQRTYQWSDKHAQSLLSNIKAALLDHSRIHNVAEEVDVRDDDDDDAQAQAETDNVAVGLPEGVGMHETQAASILEALFLGNLILRKEGSENNIIYDGMQRITTLTILIAILRDMIEDPALKTRLHQLIHVDGTKNYRLSHALRNDFLYFKIQRLGEAAKKRNTPKDHAKQRVFSVSKIFREDLMDEDQGYLEALSLFLLEKCLFNITFMRQERAAAKAFVDINHNLLRLTKEEIFKGQLIGLSSTIEGQDEIKQKWDEIRAKVDGDYEQFEQFLKAVDMIERVQVQSDDYLNLLANHLSEMEESVFLNWLNSLEVYAEAWQQLQHFLWKKDKNDVAQQVRRLSYLKWDEWQPLALYFMERYIHFESDKNKYIVAGKKDEFKKTVKRFSLLGSRCMGTTILGTSDFQRKKNFCRAIHVLTKRETPIEPFNEGYTHFSQMPLNFDDAMKVRIKEKLVSPFTHYEARRTIMLWLEDHLWANSPKFHLSGEGGATLEHILPITLPTEQSQWHKDFPDAARREHYTNLIGNFVLVERKVNDELLNKDFKFKYPILKKRKQFGKYKVTQLVETKEKKKIWTHKEIEKLTKTRSAQILAILSLPEPR